MRELRYSIQRSANSSIGNSSQLRELLFVCLFVCWFVCQEREDWVEYATFDAVATFKLHAKLREMLTSVELKVTELFPLVSQ